MKKFLIWTLGIALLLILISLKLAISDRTDVKAESEVVQTPKEPTTIFDVELVQNSVPFGDNFERNKVVINEDRIYINSGVIKLNEFYLILKSCDSIKNYCIDNDVDLGFTQYLGKVHYNRNYIDSIKIMFDYYYETDSNSIDVNYKISGILQRKNSDGLILQTQTFFEFYFDNPDVEFYNEFQNSLQIFEQNDSAYQSERIKFESKKKRIEVDLSVIML